ncbi:MAG: polysaccharide deacetylase family protein [Solirubrobacteraceae bacterium]
MGYSSLAQELAEQIRNPQAWSAGNHNQGDIVNYAGGSWAALSDFSDVYFDAGQWKPLMPVPLARPSWRLPAPTIPTVITDFAAGHGFTAAGNNGGLTNLNDTSDFAFGTQAATIASAGTGTQTTLTNTALTAFDTTGKQVIVVGKIDNPQHLASGGTTNISVYLGNDTTFTNYWLFKPGNAQLDWFYGPGGDWLKITLNWQDATIGAGAPTRTGIVTVRLRILDDNTGNSVIARWNLVALEPEPSTVFPNGAVSITFDDGFLNTWQNGWPILSASGLPSTQYLIADYLGTSGRPTLQQMLWEQDLGRVELACHAYRHDMHNSANGYTDFTYGQIYADFAQLKQFAVQNGFRGADHLAYPHGSWSDNVIQAARQFFSTGRTIAAPSHETLPPADFMRLRAVSSISSFAGGITPATVNTLIDNAKANHGWLILVFHEITSGAAASTTQCSAADFQTIITHIQSSGIACLPVGEVLKTAS